MRLCSSMTGFGRGEAFASGRTWTVEIKTVNHRFLDQRVILPRQFAEFEEVIKKKVASVFNRGKADIVLTLQGSVTSVPRFIVNDDVVSGYLSCLKQITEQYQVDSNIAVSDILMQRDVITQEEQRPDTEAEWELIEAALEQALQVCDEMRQQEGQALKNDLLDRLQAFKKIVDEIEANAPVILAQRHADLKEKLERLLDGINVDEARLAQEAAIMADKSDITEEVVRLSSHIGQFKAFLDSEEPVGRRLDFLLQEFLREVNTLASKISNAAVAHLGVEMKNEIEKLREQVQNIE